MSINCVINSGVVNIMRKNAGVYDSTFKYIIGHLQKSMKILFNPIYDNMLPDREKEIHYWTLDLKSKKNKKGFKNSNDSKYFPDKINIESEEQKTNRARERLKKRQSNGKNAEVEKKDIFIPKKSDIIEKAENDEINKNTFIEPSKLITGNAGILNNNSNNIKTEKKSTKEELVKKSPIFQVLVEKNDYVPMIKSNKNNGEHIELKIQLEEYSSISQLAVDISKNKILITDPSL